MLDRQRQPLTANSPLTVAAGSVDAGRGWQAVSAAQAERRIRQGAAACTLVRGSGRLLACPRLPDEGRREGSLVKSAAARTTSPGFCGPVPLSFAPADRRERPAGREPGTSSLDQVVHAQTDTIDYAYPALPCPDRAVCVDIIGWLFRVVHDWVVRQADLLAPQHDACIRSLDHRSRSWLARASEVSWSR